MHNRVPESSASYAATGVVVICLLASVFMFVRLL
mgnify:CR=1 FL=1|jgi:hypothetical protein